MAPPDRLLSLSLTSMVEDVLQQHGGRLSDNDLASRKAEQAASRRYEATGWLRKMVGAVGTRDLPAEPTEEEFRIGLRSGIILCNALNKVQPGAVPKVVEVPCDSTPPPDGAALTAYQYFENVRNFLDAVEEMGIPTFEASDLNQGGKPAKVVTCILALKSYSDWKQAGGHGLWKYSGNPRPSNTGKCFVRKNSDAFMGSLSRMQSLNERYVDGVLVEQNVNGEQLAHDSCEMNASRPLDVLVRTVLTDKRPEEIPALVESLLRHVMEEVEHRISSENVDNQEGKVSLAKRVGFSKMSIRGKESKDCAAKQIILFEQQKKEIQALRHTLDTTKAEMQHMQMMYCEDWVNLGQKLKYLTHAASSYQRIFEENRKLYNQVQDLKGSIRVYCRVRPFLSGQHSLSSVDHMDDGIITILTPSKYGKEVRRTFSFNKVFGPSATQADVFADTQPLIRSVLDGYNVCIFAYGQTGSGKTYTMSGPRSTTEETRGVNFRALSDLFHLSEERRDCFSYEVSVQMVEIYNEQVRDLLATDASTHRKLEIRNNSQKGVNVPDANVVPVSSTSDILELMEIGQKNRAVGSTAINDRSSRSHSCLTVHVQGREISSETVLRGTMHLVDLAGSERVDKSEATGERLKEAQHINRSLSALGDVISALAQKNSHVPYRNSKLTQLLQDSLGGHAKTLMFVHINPDVDAIGETISTLKFAERVASVELGAARVNRDSGEMKDLKEQIAALKAALGRKGGGGGERIPSPDVKACGMSPLYSHVHGGEPENLRGTMSNPDIPRTKARGASPVHLTGHCREGAQLRCTMSSPDVVRMKARAAASPGGGEMFRGRSKFRQPMGEVGNIENTAFRQKRTNDDMQEFSSSALWPDKSPRMELQKEDGKDAGGGEWVDKVMVNKDEGEGIGHHQLRHWQVGAGSLPNLFYIPDTKGFPERREAETTTVTDDSDEVEAGTSDSSEADALWQVNISNIAGIPASPGTKMKNSQPKPVKGNSNSDHRNSVSLNGSLRRHKLATIAIGCQSFNRVSGRPDGKRCHSNGKPPGGKQP